MTMMMITYDLVIYTNNEEERANYKLLLRRRISDSKVLTAHFLLRRIPEI